MEHFHAKNRVEYGEANSLKMASSSNARDVLVVHLVR
jgi:hypothetical protein